MYLGHVGLALGARTVDRSVPVLPFVVAAIAPDLLVARRFHHLALAPFVVAGVTAVTAVVWRSLRATAAVAALAISHYAADFLTAGVRMRGGDRAVGLRLYDSPLADLVVEAAVIVAGWLVWRRAADSPDGRRAALAVLAVMLVFQAGFSLVVADRLLA